jgi:hypothetical protein
MATAWMSYLSVFSIISLFIAIIAVNPLSFRIPSIPFRFSPGADSCSGTKLECLAAKYREGCPLHRFDSVKRLSRVPDITIIEGFLTEDEAEVLVEIAFDTPEMPKLIQRASLRRIRSPELRQHLQLNKQGLQGFHDSVLANSCNSTKG